MFENDAKGWHGSYSLAGRTSAEKYQMIINKEKILKGNNFNQTRDGFTFKSIFTPDKPLKKECIEDKLDVLRIYPKKNNVSNVLIKTETEKNNKNKKKQYLNNEKYKYHNRHIKEGRKKKEIFYPSCTKYNPNHGLIWSRTITGPTWNSLQGRKTKPPPIDVKDFFINDEPLENRIKCFINMNKQTQRGDSLHGKDVRIRTDRTLPKSDFENLITLRSFSSRNNNSNSNFNDNFDSTISKLETEKTKRSKSTLFNVTHSQKKYIKGPNFSKTISREQVNKIKNPKKNTPNFKDPSFSLIHEKIVTLFSFNPPKTNPRSVKKLKGIDPDFLYNPDTYISKVNNHKKCSTSPNFELMVTRPNNEILPSFMVDLFNRHGVNCVTNQTFKMNNYKNSNFQKTSQSGFFPKRSYNRYINLNMLDGDRYKNDEVKDEEIQNEKKILTERAKNKINNKMFNEYNEYINSEYDHKFDNVTYKTVKRKISKHEKDFEKYTWDC